MNEYTEFKDKNGRCIYNGDEVQSFAPGKSGGASLAVVQRRGKGYEYAFTRHGMPEVGLKLDKQSAVRLIVVSSLVVQN